MRVKRRPHRVPFWLRARARSRCWAAMMSGWRALALRQRRYAWSWWASTVWLGWFDLPMTKVRSGPNWASMGLAQEALVGVKHNSTRCFDAQLRIAGVLLADRLSRIT